MPFKNKTERKNLGLCKDCNNKAIYGYSRCLAHLESHKIEQKKLYYKRKDEGRCYYCGKPLIGGEWSSCYVCKTISHSRLYRGNMRLLKGVLKYANTDC